MAIYYLIPDLHRRTPFSIRAFLGSVRSHTVRKYIRKCFFLKPRPIGGIKVIYQHCLILKKLGYDVYPVLMGRYVGNFYGYELEFKKLSEVIDSVSQSDIVVATEFAPYQGLLFKSAKKILFLQNWLGLYKWLNTEDQTKSYFDLGYDHVITCSDYCSNYVQANMKIPATTVPNGIDLEQFKPDTNARVKNRILAMSRKNPDDLKKIIALLHGGDYEIKVVDDLSQSALIREYQSADIFLATGYPEGFGLPPLEAMACGCVVVGFTGGGASEFMISDETALVSDDGDIEDVVQKLQLLAENGSLKENIRLCGYKKSQYYSLDTTEKQLDSFFKTLI